VKSFAQGLYHRSFGAEIVEVGGKRPFNKIILFGVTGARRKIENGPKGIGRSLYQA